MGDDEYLRLKDNWEMEIDLGFTKEDFEEIYFQNYQGARYSKSEHLAPFFHQ